MNSTDPRETYAAVVHGPGGVHFIAVCADHDTLWLRLASYVREWAPYQLGPAAFDTVVAAFERDDLETGVRAYFQHAGLWDPESLVIETLDADSVFSTPGLPGVAVEPIDRTMAVTTIPRATLPSGLPRPPGARAARRREARSG